MEIMTLENHFNLNARLDQLLYYLRFFKTRGIASKAIERGSCNVNDFVIKKKNKVINIGDIVIIKNNDIVKKIKILRIPIRRGPFKEACTHYEDITPFILQKTKEKKFLNKISYGRRPTKSNRRKLDKFTGRNF